MSLDDKLEEMKQICISYSCKKESCEKGNVGWSQNVGNGPESLKWSLLKCSEELQRNVPWWNLGEDNCGG